MLRTRIVSAALTLALASLAASGGAHSGTTAQSGSRVLTFQERVEAQEAIERVYYSHQIGVKRPFADVVTQEMLERKVRAYLAESVALEKLWQTPVTAGMLHREAERMAQGTRMPERLRELHAALDNDPTMILECLARPVLVDRLARSFFASDERIHASARMEAVALRQNLVAGRTSPMDEEPNRTLLEVMRADDDVSGAGVLHNSGETQVRPGHEAVLETLRPEDFDRWSSGIPTDVGQVGPVTEERDAFLIRVMLEHKAGLVRLVSYRVEKRSWDDWWAEVQAGFAESEVATVAPDGNRPLLPDSSASNLQAAGGAASLALCSPDDTWDNGSLDDAPGPRTGHTTVWTGSLMIVWGGFPRGNTGGRYDPGTDTWTPTSTIGAPDPRDNGTAVWTGSLMIVWGGRKIDGVSMEDGGRYDPLTDSWSATSLTNAPAPRYLHTAVWAAGRMVVWGGVGEANDPPGSTGGRYDPDTDTWQSTSTSNAPSPRSGHTAVWTGSQMIVWGGTSSYTNTGGRYDPVSDVWVPTSVVGAPAGRNAHTAVWTGNVMIVWGGQTAGGVTGTGGRYDPVADAWVTTNLTNAPSARYGQSAAWTGSSMVIWGGRGVSAYLDTGSRYDPVADTWSPATVINAPAGRVYHTTVWSGSLMLVWGGNTGAPVDTGGRYDPVSDTWTPTSRGGAPSARRNHTAIWTGNELIIWGGAGFLSAFGTTFGTGGRYNPATDAWSAITLSNTPAARADHSAVWTGSRMVIWGGADRLGNPFGTGGLYDPIQDSWAPTSLTNAPSPRSLHTAVWTGARMLIWGGSGSNSGGSYDPLMDSWATLTTTNAPAARSAHTAIWTGSRMVIWGGDTATGQIGTGGRYDPLMDQWQPTTSINAPSPRDAHTATWTGGRMIIWGGNDPVNGRVNTGGQYDPNADTWTPTALTGAPAPRSAHTAIWAGASMVVWGGFSAANTHINTGGRYDPSADQWITVTSMTNVPAHREQHTAVWTGSFMIVWGGYGGEATGAGTFLDSGGRYALGQSLDNDGDGLSECQGDCDDTRNSVHPGALQICDGLNNDCDAPGWPGLAGTNEADNDADGLSTCQGDCDDTKALVWGTPGEASNLELAHDAPTGTTYLTWSEPVMPGGVSVVYDIIATGTPVDFVGGATCIQSDGPSAAATDSTAPAPGGIFYYLVRAENTCPGSLGTGPLGADSNGVPRTGRACP